MIEPGAAAHVEEPAPEGALLEVRNLKTIFRTEGGVLTAVDDVSFDVASREIFAIVGESGSGKTVTALSILGLVPEPAGKIVGGEILYRGENLLKVDKERLRQIRGDRIAMIFQDPLTALNPVHRIGSQIAEVYLAHRNVSKDEAWARAVQLLERVGIPQPARRAGDYPHQFSGGMRQRAMIAMALALDPDLLIADEPTTALDVTIQAQILDVLRTIREEFNTAIMMITHDLGVVAEVADRVMVMYAGRKVEESDVVTLYDDPKMPYTWGLLGSTTRPDRPRRERLIQIPGAPPSLISPPHGCRFSPRCVYAQPVCHEQEPALLDVTYLHEARCHFALEDGWKPGVPVEVAARAAEGMAS
ncbi:MAG: ABC transporter ATP-binding protein [Actinomycetota bacterium]|nr:ABC transporter ATP-binding protein [Actinomycetota bacterium]